VFGEGVVAHAHAAVVTAGSGGEEEQAHAGWMGAVCYAG
jgi:hypothetical protein